MSHTALANLHRTRAIPNRGDSMRSRAADINTDRLAFDEAAETVHSKQSRWIMRVLIRVIGHVYILRYSGPEVRAVPREISGGRAGGPLACLSPFSGVRCLI